MTRLRYLALAIGLAFLVTIGGTRADDKKPDPPQPRRGAPDILGQLGNIGSGGGPLLVPELADKLKLTDDQKGKVEKLQKEFEDKVKDKTGKIRDELEQAIQNQDIETIRKLPELMRNIRQEAQKVRDDYEGKLKGLLTDDQKKTFEAVMKDRPPAGGFPGGGIFPGGGGFPGGGRTPPQPKELTTPA